MIPPLQRSPILPALVVLFFLSGAEAAVGWYAGQPYYYLTPRNVYAVPPPNPPYYSNAHYHHHHHHRPYERPLGGTYNNYGTDYGGYTSAITRSSIVNFSGGYHGQCAVGSRAVYDNDYWRTMSERELRLVNKYREERYKHDLVDWYRQQGKYFSSPPVGPLGPKPCICRICRHIII